LLDQLGVNTFHLIGLSMGGSIAVDYAVLRPSDLRSLVLIDAGTGGLLSRAAGSFRDLALRGGVEAAKQAWLADGLFIPARRDPELERRLEEIVGDYSGWHWTADTIQQIVPNPPVVERLASITAPTLVVVGELDIPRMQDNADLLSKIPGARKAFIAGAGHMANMEKPEEVNQLILDFLAEL
jgi:pimeloyl-ACP methyl ester carboxylesterase